MMSTRAYKYFTVLVGVLAAAWLTGLVLFVMQINTFAEPVINDAMPTTEAIVVLTGGSERLATGLDLLTAGKGQKLLVSGVHQGLKLDHLLAHQTVSQPLRQCCITLGHEADNTIGNAEETKAWMKAENFHSLRLVTAHYHMPRSLLLFHRAMPDIIIIPHPIAPDSVKLGDWWLRSGTASLLVTEYSKYLFASLRARLESL